MIIYDIKREKSLRRKLQGLDSVPKSSDEHKTKNCEIL